MYLCHLGKFKNLLYHLCMRTCVTVLVLVLVCTHPINEITCVAFLQ
jgi:hypothetical protein